MRRLTVLFLVVLSLIAAIPATPLTAAPDAFGYASIETAKFNSEIVLKDRSATAERLLEDANRRLQELDALEAAAELDGARLSDALERSLPSGDIDAFKKRYRVELRLARFPDKAYAWRDAADAYRDRGHTTDAYGAAWRMLQMAASSREEATALDSYAKIMLAENKAEDAMITLRDAQAISKDNKRLTWLNAVTARFTLRVTDQQIDVEGRMPRACLILSHQILKPLPISLEDYVLIKGGTDVALQGDGNRICITGLTFGDRAEVTLLAGLPGKAGAKLYADTVRTFTVPDRAPRTLLGNGTYVLPKVGNETIPLKSVNVSNADLKLFRIPDRGLVPWQNSGRDGQNLSVWVQNDLGNQMGESVWTGSVEIKTVKNKDVTTLVPIRDILEAVQPGIYALVASKAGEKQRNWTKQQTQWLVISDIGIMSLHGADGMHIFTHSLETAKPLRNVTVNILGKNNDILAQAKTDRNGRVSIAAELLRGKGGNMPALLEARTRNGDFSFIKLTGPALDLSDRGTGGRLAKSPLDAFMFTERGIYRPGETVYLTALLRDEQARAVSATALSLIITRPDGVEALNTRLTGDALGAYGFDYHLSGAARTGMWRASLHASNETESIGDVRFQVDAFVPERMRTKLETVEDQLSAGKPLEVQVQADFLYGAPAADLNGTLTATIEPDPQPFEAWKEYQFGLVQEDFSAEPLTQLPLKTDAAGMARVALLAEQLPYTTKPLKTKLTAELQDVGGRPVSATVWRPVQRAPLMLGVRAEKPDGFDPSEPATLSVVALDNTGTPVPDQPMTIVWVKEHYSYTWYQHRGRWQHRTSHYDEIIGEENINSGQDGIAVLKRTLPWGRYRLDVSGPEGNTASSIRFTVGWWSRSESPDIPDGLELTIENDSLSAGDRVRGFVKAPFEGTAIVAVANDRLLETQTIPVSLDGTKFDFRVKADWGPSAYIMVTALRPGAGEISRLPVRATGLAWFSVGRKERSRKIEITVPDIAPPGEPVTIPIKLLGGTAEDPVRVTVAAVDEGILNITRFKSPNPDAYYFGKRAFGFDVRDLYGRLIRSEEGKRGRLRTGGDRSIFGEILVSGARMPAEDNLASSATRTRKTVALVTRNISLNGDGEGSVTLNLPDFMGRLRLMAVAASADTIGTGSAHLTVRSPIVADLITPRFLAPGDEAFATFTVQNLSGKDETFTADIATDSAAISLTSPQPVFHLKNGERRDVKLPLRGNTVGTASIQIAIAGPEIKTVHRTFDISVRPAWPFSTRRARLSLEPGASALLDSINLADFDPSALTQSLSVSSRPNLEAERIFQELNAYPYRCSEQTVSRATPSLLHKDLNALYGLSINTDHAQNTVEQAIMILLDRQRANGSFRLWSGYGTGYAWLDVYVTDFLTRAAEKGYFVPDAALTMAKSRLTDMTARRGRGFLEATAYAHYVLARTGGIDGSFGSGGSSASEVRYFADQFGGKLETPLALAQLAGALDFVGETHMSEQFFVRAVRKVRPARRTFGGDYGTPLRDLAAITALIAESDNSARHLAALSDKLEGNMAKDQWYSTQEMAWLARAAAAFANSSGEEAQFTLDGGAFIAKGGFWRRNMKARARTDETTIENTGDVALKAVHLVRGVTKKAPEQSANGFSHNRSFYDLQGNPLNPEKLPRNGRFVVLLWGKAFANTVEDPLIVDLLPAGFEIDSTDTSSLTFLEKLSPTVFSDARDDRFVAALKIQPRARGNARNYQVAYIVRAITPGDYVLPGPFVEDMYQPQYRFQGAASRLVIED